MGRDYRPAESLSCSCKLALNAHKIIKEMGAGSNSPVKKKKKKGMRVETQVPLEENNLNFPCHQKWYWAFPGIVYF